VTSTPYKDQLLALAALIQAVSLASELAMSGVCDIPSAQQLIAAIYVFDTPSTDRLYPARQLTAGLRAFSQIFAPSEALKASQQSQARYVIKLNNLAKKLNNNPGVMAELAERIKHATVQRDFFLNEPDRTLESLSGIYLWLAHELKVDFKILGQSQYLLDHQRVNRIRALLLAGVRAAVLWQQLGGSAWHLWWRRKTYLHLSQQLLIN